MRNVMKKDYRKPSCKVYELKQRTHLLAGSDRGQHDDKESDDWLNYSPRIDSEKMNNLA